MTGCLKGDHQYVALRRQEVVRWDISPSTEKILITKEKEERMGQINTMKTNSKRRNDLHFTDQAAFVLRSVRGPTTSGSCAVGLFPVHAKNIYYERKRNTPDIKNKVHSQLLSPTKYSEPIQDVGILCLNGCIMSPNIPKIRFSNQKSC
jgi:hypothetical protein